MKVEAFSLYWENTKSFFESSQKVMKHLKIPVEYQLIDKQDHAEWINKILRKTNADIVVFFDVDCVPANREVFDECLNYVKRYGTMIGIAQASNHINGGLNIFVGPSFCIIDINFYKKIGKPSAKANYKFDVFERITQKAKAHGFRYKTMIPLKFEKIPDEGIWHLGSHSNYGIGTYYYGGIYNLFQSRFEENLLLYQSRCNQIINGTFKYEDFTFDCSETHYDNTDIRYKKIGLLDFLDFLRYKLSIFISKMKSFLK